MRRLDKSPYLFRVAFYYICIQYVYTFSHIPYLFRALKKGLLHLLAVMSDRTASASAQVASLVRSWRFYGELILMAISGNEAASDRVARVFTFIAKYEGETTCFGDEIMKHRQPWSLIASSLTERKAI